MGYQITKRKPTNGAAVLVRRLEYQFAMQCIMLGLYNDIKRSLRFKTFVLVIFGTTICVIKQKGKRDLEEEMGKKEEDREN